MKLIKQNFNGEEKFKMFYFFIRERKFYGEVSDAVSNRELLVFDYKLTTIDYLFKNTLLSFELESYGCLWKHFNMYY